MSRTAPRTGGKAAPKSQSPPRDAAGAPPAPEDASSGGADTLRTRRRSTEHGAAGGNDDASGKAGASNWNTLSELLQHKALLQSMLRGTKAIHTNVSDAARSELNVPKRMALYACAHALSVPATLADRTVVMSALKHADRGIGWVYDRAGGAVGRLAADGERVAHDSGKAFDATVNATPAKAELTPVKLNGNGSGGLKALLYQLTAVMVYLTLTVARGVVQALANPRATADAIKCGVQNALSLAQWQLRLNAVYHAGQRVWASRSAGAKADAAAEPGGSVRSALMEFAGAVALLLMPWRSMPDPVQRAQ